MDHLRKFNLPVPRGVVAHSPSAALSGALKLNLPEVVVKAQVLAGGRGKGYFKPTGLKGGVHVCPPEAVETLASQMIGMTLITKQTGARGKPCDKLLIQEKVSLSKELYFAILMDRKTQGPVIVASPMGGMNIEEVAETHPHAIHSFPFPMDVGLTSSKVDEICDSLEFSSALRREAHKVFPGMWECFAKSDILQLEINPLGVTSDEKLVLCDAKLSFDENASYRQPETYSMRDLRQENFYEIEAQKYGLSYIEMDGNIGCLVNGAGLAMATMDLIKLLGGEPANFLDVGGGSKTDQIIQALRILETNTQVDAILINIFGGIMRCDVIAQGLISAVKQVNIRKPIVARLMGTNSEIAATMLKQSQVPVIFTHEEEDAVEKVVSVAQIVRQARKVGISVSFQGTE